MSKPTELDANRLLDSEMPAHYKAAAYHLASHQQLTPDEALQMAQRAHVGCSGDCAEQGDCNCSHSIRWMAPRQPRRPEPRTPHLPLWTRLKLVDWRHWLLMVGLGFSVVGSLYAVSELAALLLARP